MTREEAFVKLNNTPGINCQPKRNDCLLDALEALGLIKFEEENIKDQHLHNSLYEVRLLANNTTKNDQTDFIKLLENCGYKIVKKD